VLVSAILYQTKFKFSLNPEKFFADLSNRNFKQSEFREMRGNSSAPEIGDAAVV
jgi:hypothetical protein